MTLGQPVISIAGIPEDHVFVHMCYVATNLSQMLPNFQFEKICKQREEWESWLKEFCKARNWSHLSSPLVWREIGVSVNNVTYVGGATQFWEFIYEYYGIESQLTTEELRSLKQDFAQEFEVEARNNVSKASWKKAQVAILGGSKSLCKNLVTELLLIEKLHRGNGIEAKLYSIIPNNRIKDIDISSDSLHNVTIVRTISAALVNCDILIILDEILRESEESTDQWLGRNQTTTLELARQINDCASNFMKVVYCSSGPTCFNANTLAAATAQKLDVYNIAVVSAHEGFKVLREMLDSDVTQGEIGSPPVWGFLGIDHFVDTCNAVQRHQIYRPNNRALKPPEGTTMSLGIKHEELRTIFYMAHDNKPQNITLEEHKVDELDLQKCEAICDLLKLWYDADADGEIISLGICSNGTFGIPEGIFFSQPVYLGERKESGSRVWVPCSEFPVPNDDLIFKNLIDTAKILIEKFINLKTVPSHPRPQPLKTKRCSCKETQQYD